ncbi:uncharacterized protein LOC106169973, partial [Lingula anatina]|uniref:Uncharacterized protein LOC106169973 n=1 Tax=Lingula anatina TaxID=7574 RepID=A0A1S3J3Y2_LINAN
MPLSAYMLASVILVLRENGVSIQDIQRQLADENVSCHRSTIYRFLERFEEGHVLADHPSSGRRVQFRDEHRDIVNHEMSNNHEMNSMQLRDVLQERTDECTVQMDSNGRYRISKRGATEIALFTGTMDSVRYQDILEAALLPFIRERFPQGHRFMQDNAPMHTSRATMQFLRENGINWFWTPPESLYLNPIELMWAEMKYYIRHRAKPKTKDQLADGIQEFWCTVDQ